MEIKSTNELLLQLSSGNQIKIIKDETDAGFLKVQFIVGGKVADEDSVSFIVANEFSRMLNSTNQLRQAEIMLK